MSAPFARRRLGSVVLGACVLAAVSAPGAVAEPEEPFDYFLNSWNVIGLKDYRHGSRITPENELLLSGKTPVQVRLGREHAPLSREHVKLAMHGWMPIILVNAVDGPVRYEVTFWATPLPDVKDWRKAFDWPIEGENYLNWICVKAVNTSDSQAEARVRIGPNPNTTLPKHFVEEQAQPKGEKVYSRVHKWSWRLKPGETAQRAARYTYFPVDDPEAYDKQDFGLWLERTEDFWRRTITEHTTRIVVPCRKAGDALFASHVCQLIANDHGELRGGEDFYDRFYPRDGAYQVMELGEAGLIEPARQAMEHFLKCQAPDGRFHGGGNQVKQLDANGQVTWTLWQHYKITGDRRFLERAYPHMLRAMRWTVEARRKAPSSPEFAGVLPAAPADGECLWDGKYHIVGYDLWNLRGMLCTADAARILGREADEKEWRAEIKDYRAAIDAAWKHTGLDHFPPSWEGRGTHWGNTETLWPTELFQRDEPRVDALIRHVREEFAGGFIEGTIQWKGKGNVNAIHPYMGAYTTMADLVRGRHEQVVEDFYWYLLHSTAAHAFPEGIFYKKRMAWNHTIPHVTGACNYALMLRHMLVHEAGDDLHLLAAVPDWWLDDGRQILIERAPTHFGALGLAVRGVARGVQVTFDPPRRRPPKRVVLHLPKSRPLARPVDGVDVVRRSDQTKRWDFPTVVALYRETAVWLKPDSVSLTTGKPATCSHALGSYPAQLANDGFTRSTDSYWATDVQHGKDPWWQVDLEKPATVGRVVVVGYYGDRRYYGFTVQTSSDGQTWQMAADRRDNRDLSTAKGYTCRFPPRPARYIRITMTHNSANTGRHVAEVMAYER